MRGETGGETRGETGGKMRGETRGEIGGKTGGKMAKSEIILGFRVPTTCGKKKFD